MSNLIVKQETQTSVFDAGQFDHSQRIALTLAKSDMVPKEYQGKPQNVLIAMELAQRSGASPIMVMQNVNVINGRPSWSSQYIIASINNCGKFQPLRFRIEKKGKAKTTTTVWENKQPKQKTIEYEEIECVAYTKDANGLELEGPAVSIGMAIAEGWHGKSGSKWRTMPDLMLRYRAASFFGRFYCPEILMGMKSTEEIQDIGETVETSYTEVKETASPLAEIVAKVAETPPPPQQTPPADQVEMAPETDEPETETEYL